MPWLPYVWVLSLHLSADRHFVMGGGDLPTEVADERCIRARRAKKTHSLRFYLLLEDSHNPEFRRGQAEWMEGVGMGIGRPAASRQPPGVGRQKRRQLDATMSDDSVGTPSCPCCAFLPDNLFLPSSVNPDEIESTCSAGTSEKKEVGVEGAGILPGAISVLSPSEAWELLLRQSAEREAGTMIVDTHGHPQLERDADNDGSSTLSGARRVDVDVAGGSSSNLSTISVACAVSADDWQSTLTYAAEPLRRERTLPALGVHPWYLYPDLSPSYLSDLESLLVHHPRAIVGEIGLCKVAKFVRQYPAELGGKPAALELQRRVFRDQFLLAAKLRRPCTVHCVQQHGVFMKLLREVREGALKVVREWKRAQTTAKAKVGEKTLNEQEAPKLTDAFPSAISMHSFTGTAHHVKELLAFEASLMGKENKPGAPSSQDVTAPIFYFGFSHAVNVEMCSSNKSRTQNIEAIQAVPMNRLLAESDVHCTADVETGTSGAIAYLSVATGVAIVDMADITTKNALDFLSSVV